MKIERELYIEEPADRLYAFWRDFRNLPTIMPGLGTVGQPVTLGGQGTDGTTFEWDAEIIDDKPNELIAWRTEGARVESAGPVRFEANA